MSEKSLNEMNFEVTIDDREVTPDPWILHYLQESFPSVVFNVKRMEEADYESTHVMVERKRIDDLWSSLQDGRFHDQINRLMTHQDKVVIYLIVGSVDAFLFKHNQLHERGIVRKPDADIIDGMIASLLVRYNFRVICDSNEHLGLKRMIRMMQKIEDEDVLDIPSKIDPLMLSGSITGLTKKQVQELARKYGTSLVKWGNLTKSQLMEIKGVGPAKADKFLKVLNSGF